jgi:hypothetical protein
VQPVPVRQDGVVYPQVLQDLDHGQWCTRQYALLRVRRVEEADVLVHVEDVAMRQALDILVDGHDLLEVLVLSVAEDGVVYDYAVDGRVVVRVDEGVFEGLAVDFAQVECEATTATLAIIYPRYDTITVRTSESTTYLLFNACLARPLSVYPSSGISAREEAHKKRLALNLAQAISDFLEQTFGDVVRKDDFAVGFVLGHGGVSQIFQEPNEVSNM